MVIDLVVASKETSKLLIDELGSVVCNHRIEYFETGEDVPLYEFSSLCSSDGGKRLCFYPLHEIVDGHYQLLYLSRGEWERT